MGTCIVIVNNDVVPRSVDIYISRFQRQQVGRTVSQEPLLSRHNCWILLDTVVIVYTFRGGVWGLGGGSHVMRATTFNMDSYPAETTDRQQTTDSSTILTSEEHNVMASGKNNRRGASISIVPAHNPIFYQVSHFLVCEIRAAKANY